MNIIINNPYRQLGVYSTSQQREIVANQGRMKAFLKVGRTVSFPLDLPGILPNINRTEESVAEAMSKLALPSDKLKYAQFWFAKSNHIDEIGFNKLLAGDIQGANDIWSKKETVSSLQNQLVCALINKRLNIAINIAENLYTNYGNEFVNMIFGDSAMSTSDKLVYNFIDELCENFNPKEFVFLFNITDWKEYALKKVTKPIIDRISAAITTANNSKGLEVTARYNAGVKLMNDTKDDLALLKSCMQGSDVQYQLIADKLSIAILQSGIDYYNGSDAKDAAQKAMRLQSYALSIAVGKLAKDRCKENVDILQDIIKNLPPMEVFDEVKAINKELEKFCNLPDKIIHSITLLNNTKANLQRIKARLGSANDFYLKISTQVVGNALHNLIEEVNYTQENAISLMGKSLSIQNENIIKALALKSALEPVLKSAWQATKIMDTFDMESGFKINRYQPQRSSLKDMCESLGIPTDSAQRVSTPRPSYGSTSPRTSSQRPTTYGTNTSSSSNNDDTNWGCVITIIIGVIIMILSNC